MSKLLRADFQRLFKNKFFWAIILLTTGYSIFCATGIYNVFVDKMKNSEFEYSIFPFEFIIALPFVVAVFTCYFIKTNESDGIIRNKLFCGHTRTAVYISNAVISVFVSTVCSVIFTACFIPFIILGKCNIKVFLAFIVVNAVLTAIIGMISTFIAFTVKGDAISIIAAVVVIALMFLATSELHKTLEDSKTFFRVDKVNGVEYSAGMVVSENDVVTYKEVENPNYCGGTKREVYGLIYKTLPTTHFMEIAGISFYSEDNKLTTSGSLLDMVIIEKPNDIFKTVNPFYSLGFGIVITAVGILIFKKKNIN